MNEVKRMRYARATYGSLAYDFGRTEAPELDYEEAPLQSPRQHSNKKVKIERERETKTEIKAKPGVSLGAALGFMVAVAMLVLVLMGYVQLTKISAETAAIQKRITELKTNEARLKLQYESTFDLTKVEEYAVARLGMVPAASSQVVYLNSTAPDKAEIISVRSNPGFIGNVSSFLSRIVEYFK